MGWLSGWKYRKKITIDHSKVETDLSDFPLKVILSSSNFTFSKALPSGNDLRFTSSDGTTELDYEREMHMVESDGLFFDGKSKITIPDNSYIDFTGSGAIACEFKRIVQGNPGPLVLKGCDVPTYGWGLQIQLKLDGLYAYILSSAGTLISTPVYNISNLAMNTWYKAECRFTSGDKLELLVNDSVVKQVNTTTTTIRHANSSLIGVSSAGSTSYACGVLLRNVQYIDNGTVVASYPLDEGSGTTATDDIHSNNGTITNPVWGASRAAYHVRVPSVSSSADTDIYMYYGRSDAADGADPENVWDSNFKLVMHMGNVLDSTSNDNDGTNYGASHRVNWDGYAAHFDGKSYITGGTPNYALTDEITIESLLYSTADTNMRILNRHDVSPNYGYLLARAKDADAVEFRVSKTGTDWNGGESGTNTYPINTEKHIAGVYDGSAMRAYVNGAPAGGSFPVSLTGNINTVSHTVLIGWGSTAEINRFAGYIKELRLSNSGRSGAWLKATTKSLADELIKTFGTEEEAVLARTMVVII